ncbi:MAG TPA: adenylate/guanylate cyclase domain-containing protein [Kamptonema sp.]|nr:adenylate/guanylate cyclase domain-containing protein [Kamptonema sp.]
MKIRLFHSIHTRIMTATTLLIVSIVGAVVWFSAVNEGERYREQKLASANSLAVALANLSTRELVVQNWSTIRLNLDLLLKGNKDFVYILVSDDRAYNQIVAASPIEFQEQYVPDVVPAAVTQVALKQFSKRSPRLAGSTSMRDAGIFSDAGSLGIETFVLRDVEFPQGVLRARRGDRIIEVAAPIATASGVKVGTFRIGISLKSVERAVGSAVKRALAIGAFALSFGLAGAYLLAKQLSGPVQRLQTSAAKIAAGDLCHRAEINLSDEIGALAASFNEMSAELQKSFSKLHKTVESFERFVPNKFLSAIASDGIENIQVGVASKRTITILFADIKGYTSMSEQLTPMETFIFLNDYLACMGLAIEEAGGFIDKYIGDAIMALFDDEATDGAVRAAAAMRKSLAEFNLGRSRNNLPTIDIGIGIHRGEVVMGTVGFTSRMDSTVIGDAVNVASRVEGLTRHYGCAVLVTESAIGALRNPDIFKLQLVDRSVKVRGKDEAIAIYQLLVS